MVITDKEVQAPQQPQQSQKSQEQVEQPTPQISERYS